MQLIDWVIDWFSVLLIRFFHFLSFPHPCSWSFVQLLGFFLFFQPEESAAATSGSKKPKRGGAAAPRAKPAPPPPPPLKVKLKRKKVAGSEDEERGRERNSDEEFERMLEEADDVYKQEVESRQTSSRKRSAPRAGIASPAVPVMPIRKKIKKVVKKVPKKELVEMENQDYCEVCGAGGEIILCDTCPKAFHVRADFHSIPWNFFLSDWTNDSPMH